MEIKKIKNKNYWIKKMAFKIGGWLIGDRQKKILINYGGSSVFFFME